MRSHLPTPCGIICRLHAESFAGSMRSHLPAPCGVICRLHAGSFAGSAVSHLAVPSRAIILVARIGAPMECHCPIQRHQLTQVPSLQLFTDTPGVGFGGLYNTARFYGTWAADQSDGLFRSIIWRELYPIAIALSLWGEQWAHHASQHQQRDYFNRAHHLCQTLLIKAGDLIRDSVASSSARTHPPGTGVYLKLCTQLGCQPSRSSVNDFLAFITHCVSDHRSSATIRVYVSAVRYYLL